MGHIIVWGYSVQQTILASNFMYEIPFSFFSHAKISRATLVPGGHGGEQGESGARGESEEAIL